VYATSTVPRLGLGRYELVCACVEGLLWDILPCLVLGETTRRMLTTDGGASAMPMEVDHGSNGSVADYTAGVDVA
jgi:hypothetical protein